MPQPYYSGTGWCEPGKIIARVGGRVLRRRVRSGSSYLSASELPVTLGLGPAARVDRVTVRWPNGGVDELPALAAGSEYRVREGRGVVGAMLLAETTVRQREPR